jgi:hypothetical protein
MELAKAGTDWTNKVKLDAADHAQAIGYINQAYENLLKTSSDAATATINAAWEKTVKDAEALSAATEKDYEATLKLASAQAKATAEAQGDVVAKDRAGKNTAALAADTAKYVQLLEQAKQAELAIVDAKIAQAQFAMQAAFDKGGMEGNADFANAEAAYREYQTKRVQIAAQADKQIAAASNQELKSEMKEWDSYFNKVNSGMASTALAVMEHHETMAQAAQKAFGNMAKAFIEYILKQIEMSIVAHAIHKTLAASEKSDAASTAAAKAGQAVADIPIVGPALAVVAGATVYAAMMAFDTGGMSKGGPALLHPNEAVLNPKQTENFRQMTEGGGNRGPLTFAPEVHVHGDFSADEHMPQILNGFQSWMRSNGVKL